MVAIAPQAAAAPNDPGRPFGTYNMQGSLGGARWNSEVGPMAERLEVVALQEAGAGAPPVPQLFNDSATYQIPGIQPHPSMPMTVNRTPWEYRGRLYTVYFLQTHVEREDGVLYWGTNRRNDGGGRNNLAIVTQEHADEVRVVNNPVFNPNSANNDYRSRRALGVRLGNTVYYNIHARGASDYQQLLGAIRQEQALHPNERYVILGDFNTNIRFQDTAEARDTVGAAPTEFLARPDRATHQGGRELDYALTRGTPDMQARVPAGIGADHYPVEFNAPGRPIPQPPGRVAHTYSLGLVNVATGSAMDAPADGSRRVITHPQRFNAQQRFNVNTYRGHWYAFQQGGSGNQRERARSAADDRRCPGVNPFDQFKIVMSDCVSSMSQWHPESPAAVRDEESGGLESGPVRWRNALWSSLCLTATGRQEDLRAQPCTDSDSQLWWESSRAVPSDSWRGDKRWVRLRAANGSYLDAQGGGESDLTNVIVHPRKNVDNQFWDVQFQNYSDNLVRLRGRDSDKCVDLRDSDTAGPGSSSVIFTCDYSNTKNDNAGQRWTAETDADGDLRLRNEANNLCLTAPDAEKGQVTVEECSTDPRQVWVPED
ncbi:ricin-type beta-trefoil lectin domain protein [Streptomyces yerevanensis]|uniref:ricin-type beta-trefoil lectin domain protein n=1 Tax=Streptomyces yerevanensis TaxID=66378 RepID=UPI000526FF85|nr:ricin-type beta-trefoil lectin domain protein [Streptomyces yerevanensis]